MSAKTSKFRYFSFTFKLNNKKKVPLKNFGLERKYSRKLLLEGSLIFIGGLEIFQKKGLDKKGQRKSRGGL